MAFTSGVGRASERPKVSLPKGGSISAQRVGGMVTLSIHGRPDLVKQLRFEIDDTVATAAEPRLAVVAELEEGIVILEDAYASRVGGLSFCQSGKEGFLRVLSLKHTGEEKLRVKLSSCVQSIELDEAGVSWNAADRTITVHWLVNNGPTLAAYEVSSRGDVQLVPGK